METRKFQYLKEDKVEDKEIVLLWQDDKYFEGIDITKLSEEEMVELDSAIKENKERLKPFYKGYRKYKRDNVVLDVLDVVLDVLDEEVEDNLKAEGKFKDEE